ncbi:MAG TPA: aspartyl protease family protein [Steroidobacteraceae bacterium]|jgi:tetratricopeptide (TPR) repeat protein|nr:aspartyl protease family protein [Steroidobacteraceae bacterium]
MKRERVDQMVARHIASVVAALALVLQCGIATAACKMEQFLSIPVTMVGYKPVVTAQINGMEVHLVLDTGAFFSVLYPEAAKRAALKVATSPLLMQGVGGTVRPGLVNIKDFGIGNQTIRHLDMLVYGDRLARGEMDGILGQNLMRAGDIEIDLAHGVARLLKNIGCTDYNLAYWSGSDPVNVLRIFPTDRTQPHVVADVHVNGHEIRALFDTGAGNSALSVAAAGRAGVTPHSAGVIPGGISFGIGDQMRDSWIAPFESLKLDQEEIRNTHLRISDFESLPQNADMLLGADFFLSHRVLISYHLNKIFFTYNGGPVFDLSIHRSAAPAVPMTAASSAPAAATPPDNPQTAPADAPEIDRRAAAERDRGELPAAIEDYGRAIAADSGNAVYHLHRGETLLRAGQPQQGMSDIEEALRLQPDLTDALMVRAQFRIRNGNFDGGRADFAAAEASAPARYELQLSESEAYAQTGHYPLALEILNSWIAAHPDDERRYNALIGRCLVRGMMDKELEAALQDCNAARRHLSSNSALLFDRGIVELRLKQYDKAIADFNDTIKLQPRLARAFYARGLARAAKGDRAGGDADLHAALDIEPRVARLFRDVDLGP